MAQMRLARAACISAGRAILFNLMSRIGLRSVEARGGGWQGAYLAKARFKM